MQTKQYFILWSLVKKYGKDNDINIVNKIAKDIVIKKQRINYSAQFISGQFIQQFF